MIHLESYIVSRTRSTGSKSAREKRHVKVTDCKSVASPKINQLLLGAYEVYSRDVSRKRKA